MSYSLNEFMSYSLNEFMPYSLQSSTLQGNTVCWCQGLCLEGCLLCNRHSCRPHCLNQQARFCRQTRLCLVPRQVLGKRTAALIASMVLPWWCSLLHSPCRIYLGYHTISQSVYGMFAGCVIGALISGLLICTFTFFLPQFLLAPYFPYVYSW